MKLSADRVFLDVETTGLEPNWHAIWEVGWVVIAPDNSEVEREVMQLSDVNMDRAHPAALEVGRFHERRLPDRYLVDPFDAACRLWELLDGAYLAGANPAFDASFLAALFEGHGVKVDPWRHHLLDVEAYAAGAFRWPVPVSLSETCRRLGIERSGTHTALGDARDALAVYEATLDRITDT